MKVFIAVASGETQHVGSLVSCYNLTRRDGDDLFVAHTTRGDVARDEMAAYFLGHPEFDAILLLDADQRHPRNMLERLRARMEAGGLDMVCAHYYRRETSIVHSICYGVGDGTYPQLPLLPVPTEGLHELLWTGFGCVLIHRRVLEAVRDTLPQGESPIGIGPLPEVFGHHENVGPDCRFFLRARRLGFRLWLDAEVESLHATTIWLGHKSANALLDYTDWANGAHDSWLERVRLNGVNEQAFKQRLVLLETRKAGMLEQFQAARAAGIDPAELAEASVAIYQMDGKIMECEAWADICRQYPPIEYPEQLPTSENSPEMQEYADTKAAREQAFAKRAKDLVNTMPQVPADPAPEMVSPNGRAEAGH